MPPVSGPRLGRRQVRLALDGPGHLRFGVEEALRAALGPLLRGLDFA